MHYTLEKSPADNTLTLCLSGSLTIQHSEALHQVLLEQTATGQPLSLIVREVEALDLSVLQLLLALKQQQKARQYPLCLQLDLPPLAVHLLQVAGLTPLNQ